MASITFEEALSRIVAPDADYIITQWNEVLSKHQDQDELGDYVCELILQEPGDQAFYQSHSPVQGLVYISDAERVKAPDQTSAALRIRNGRISRTRSDVVVSIITELDEPVWQETESLFAGWNDGELHTLPPRPDLARELIEQNQKRWDTAELGIDVGMGGGSVKGFFGILYRLFHPRDWRSLYRSRELRIRTWPPDIGCSQPRLLELESWLFSTIQYDGIASRLTVLTYGQESTGTATVFEISPTGNIVEASALSVRPVASLTDVPKQILRSMGKEQESKIKLVFEDGKIKCSSVGVHPRAVQVTTRNEGRDDAAWIIGGGWRSALQIQHWPNTETDGLLATIPQMIALLHLKRHSLHSIRSSSLQVFTPHLSSAHTGGIARGIKLLGAPRGSDHPGNKVTVVVMFPRDSVWVREKILWV